MNLIKAILISLGTLSLCIGIIGVFVPGLPTTPFILLTAGFYIKSSDELYNRLINNRLFGHYLLEFRTNKGMTKRTKGYAIGTMWVMIVFSCVFLIAPLSLKIVVSAFGVIGTIVMGFVVPTKNISNNSNH